MTIFFSVKLHRRTRVSDAVCKVCTVCMVCRTLCVGISHEGTGTEAFGARRIHRSVGSLVNMPHRSGEMHRLVSTAT